MKTKKMVLCALLAALGIIIGFFCKAYLTFLNGTLRVTFENLPIIFCGMVLGPVYGGIAGGVADILSALFSGYSINPIITLGSIVVGAISGLVFNYIFKSDDALTDKILWVRILLSELSSHLIGSVIIKTIGLYVWTGMPLDVLAWRFPLYIGISAVEFLAIRFILKNKTVLKECMKIRGR